MNKIAKLLLLPFTILLFNANAQDAGQAVSLDGDGDFIQFPVVAPSPDLNGGFTVECWVKLNSVDAFEYFVSIRELSYVRLGVSSGSNIYAYAAGLTPSSLTTVATISLDTWVHVAYTYAGTRQAIYINGALSIENTTTTGALTVDGGWLDGIKVGALFNGTSGFIDGSIDEVRIWNHARSEELINAYKNTRAQGVESGLVRYWRMDGDATDGTSNGSFNGTAQGDASFVDSEAPLTIRQFTRVDGGDLTSDLNRSWQGNWGDYDGDDYPDLFVPSIDMDQSALYHNNQNGTFTKTVAGELGGALPGATGASWGDYDNDGDLDLFVAINGNNALYRNNGDGTFTNVGSGNNLAGDLGNDGVASYNGAWADYDGDGFLDLFVANIGANHLYHNDGDGTFTLTTNFSADTYSSYGVAWGDYDNDGDPDLFVANNSGTPENYFYRNNNGTSFTKITTAGSPGDVTHQADNYSANWVDINNDGFLDLFVPSLNANNLLYINDGDGTFTQRVTGTLVSEATSNYSAAWGDYDNDGDQDVLLTLYNNRGSVIFKNTGNGFFTKDLGTIVSNDLQYALGASWADVDLDGDLDLFMANYSTAAGNGLYINEGNSNDWITLDLQASPSQPSLYGTTVKAVDANGDIHGFVQITSQDGRGQNDGLVHFGLPLGVTIDHYEISWPSGMRQWLVNYQKNTFVTVEEGVKTSQKPSVLILGATLDNYLDDVQDQVFQFGYFDQVHWIDVRDSTPDISTLMDYDALLIWSNGTFGNADSLGNRVADYIDNGGFVVTGVFAIQQVAGRFLGGRYNPDYQIIQPATVISTAATLGTINEHVINDGVSSFSANYGYRIASPILASGASVITEWSDGAPLVVIKEGVGTAGTRRADLNFFPNSSNVSTNFWDASTDGGRLMANVLLWGSGPPDAFSRVLPIGAVTDSIVVDKSGSFGAAWGDFDGDNNLDLYVGNFGAPGFRKDFLYENNGDGTFTRNKTDNTTIVERNSIAPIWGDYNNDGFLDLLFPTNNDANQLYVNNGNGTLSIDPSFNDLTTAASITGSFADYDNDGFLDMFIANGDTSNFLYHNNGDGTFSPNTDTAIANAIHPSYTGTWADYDGDGDQDLYVLNLQNNANNLFENNGAGNFSLVGPEAGPIVTDTKYSSGASWADFDNDGDLDVYVTNLFFQANDLYINNGDKTFSRLEFEEPVLDKKASFSSCWGDYDNDGDLDLYVSNQSGKNDLYENNGDGTFDRVLLWGPVFGAQTTAGAAWADYDNDGDLDLFVTSADDTQTNLLFQNSGNDNHWLNVKLLGVESNKSAIGAKIYAVAGGKTQFREIISLTGFGSQNSLNEEFGFGAATTLVDTIKVVWPTGREQFRYNISVDQFITIEEDTVPPGDFDVYAAVTGGNIVANRWNSTNTGLNITIGIPNDPSLINGTVQLVATIDGGGYENIGSSVPINNDSIGSVMVLPVTEAEIEGVTGFGFGANFRINAVLTDQSANTTEGTLSENFLVDQSTAAAFTVGAVVASGGTLVDTIWNSTNTHVMVTIPIENNPQLAGWKLQVQAKVDTTDFETLGSLITITPEMIGASLDTSFTRAQLTALASFADGNTFTFAAVLSNDNGNPSTTATSSSSRLFVDESVPNVVSSDFPKSYIKGLPEQYASITLSDENIIHVSVMYKGITQADTELTSMALNSSNNRDFLFDLSVLEAMDEPMGVEYTFTYSDASGNGQVNMAGFTHIFHENDEMTIPGLKFGKKVTDYQIVSIPLVLDSNKVSDVFADDLGPYDINKWRIFHYVNGSNAEVQNGTIALGQGYWLIAAKETAIDLGTGTLPTATEDNPSQITLNNGWNQIGNPYLFSISWADVLEHNGIESGIDTELTLYESGFINGDVLEAFRGAFVYRDGDDITLEVPVTRDLSIQNARKTTVDRKNEIDQNDWLVRLDLHCQGFDYKLGGFGMKNDASVSFDPYDRLNAPHFVEFLELTFLREQLTGRKISRDIVPSSEAGQWSFVVESSFDEPVTLSWDNSYWGDTGKKLVLFDEATQKSLDMRLVSSYSFTNEGRVFKILYGNDEAIEQMLKPASFDLGRPYPNPMVGRVNLPVSVPGQNDRFHLTLNIYDLTGKLVKSILDDEMNSGYHLLSWEGTNESGVKVNAGTYFVEMLIDDEKIKRKFVRRVIVE